MTIVAIAFTHGSNHQRHVVLVYKTVSPQKFAGGVKARCRGDTLKRKSLVTDFFFSPKRTTGRTGKDLDDIGLELPYFFTILANTVQDCPGVAIGKAGLDILVNVRGHDQSAVFVAMDRGPENIYAVVLVKEWEFQRIGEKMFVIQDFQIAVINFVSGLAVQFKQEGILSLCYQELPAEGFPASDMRGVDM